MTTKQSAVPVTPAYDTITTVAGLDHVRLRPGMYVGDVTANEFTSAPMHLLREAVGNALDEHMGGHATKLTVTLLANAIEVRDNGRGIPFNHNAEHNRSNLEVAVGVINSGAKFNKRDEKSAFSVSAGLHGIGAKAINALSSKFVAVSRRDGKQAICEFSKGVLVDATHTMSIGIGAEWSHGTEITWMQDADILPNLPRPEHVEQYLTEMAYINPNLKIIFSYGNKPKDLSQPGGVTALARTLVADDQRLTKDGLKVYITDPATKNVVDTLILFTRVDGDSHTSYVNCAPIGSASAPIVVMRSAIARGITDALESTYGKLPEGSTPNDVRSGIITITRIFHTDPAFHGQVKDKLISTDLNAMISEEFTNAVRNELLGDAKTLSAIHDHVRRIVRAREAANAARNKAMNADPDAKEDKAPKLVSRNKYDPPLSDDRSKNQLFLSEGDSASGSIVSAVKVKDPKTGKLYKEHVGVLSLRGVTLNTLEHGLNYVLTRSDTYNLIVRIAGLNPKKPADLSTLKFKEFIIATDEDAGGAFIAAQIMMFFAIHFPEIIKQGKLARVRTPLFEVKTKKATEFIYSWEDKNARLIELGLDPTQAGKAFDMKRNKGLGEMSKLSAQTLVSADQKLEYIQHPNPVELLPLLYLMSGEENADARKDVLFKIALPEDLD